jgi:HPt (histidine-containing phosphotransfer) domain-containing protein
MARSSDTASDRRPAAVDTGALDVWRAEIDGLEDVIRLFVDALPARCDAIAAAVAAREPAAAADAAHALKSPAAMLGGHALADLCRLVELEALRGVLPSPALVGELVEESHRVERALREALAVTT